LRVKKRVSSGRQGHFLCAWLIPGKDVSIDKGTLFDAVTLSPVELHV